MSEKKKLPEIQEQYLRNLEAKFGREFANRQRSIFEGQIEEEERTIQESHTETIKARKQRLMDRIEADLDRMAQKEKDQDQEAKTQDEKILNAIDMWNEIGFFDICQELWNRMVDDYQMSKDRWETSNRTLVFNLSWEFDWKNEKMFALLKLTELVCRPTSVDEQNARHKEMLEQASRNFEKKQDEKQ